MDTKSLKTFFVKKGLIILFFLFTLQSRAADAFYVGENFYINGPAYTGTMDAIAWYSDRPNDIRISGNNSGANVVIDQYFSGIATIECQYAYHYYVGTKRYNETGHSRINVSCRASTVKISKDELTLAPGETVTLSYSNSSGYKIPLPYWGVDDRKIATVDDYDRSTEQTITVKGISPGTATITFYANTGNENPTCKVTVRDIPATAISLSPSSLSINEGKTARFTVEYTPKEATSAITWSIKDENIASITSAGTIKGIAEGTTTVTATTSNGLTATGTVYVVPQPKEIKLPSAISLYKGYNILLEPTLLPSSATTTYKWNSSAPKVADVDAAGNVFAKTCGTAQITVTTGNGLSASTTITVTEPIEELDYRNISKRIEAINELIIETVKTLK